MEVRQIRTSTDLAAIHSDWNELLESDPSGSVFKSWEWNYFWWQHYGKSHTLQIITVWIDGQLKAILPVYLQRTSLLRLWNLTCVRFVCTGGDTSPDDLGPIVDPATAGVTVPVLVSCLLDDVPEWDVLRLTDLDKDSMFSRELINQCLSRKLHQVTEVSATIAFAELPPSWDDYLAGVHRDRRNTIRRTRRKVESQHQGRFHVVTEQPEVDDALSSLIELHHRRWRGTVGGHAFSTQEYLGFHRDAIHACIRQGWIRFYCLEADGKRIAVFYCYRFRNKIFYFQAGFDPDYERLRPGLVLIGYAIEHAIEEGNSAFDFLRGEHSYKNQWGKSLRETHTLVAYRPGLRAKLHRIQRENIPAAKRRLKSILRRFRGDCHPGGGGHAQREQSDA